MSDLEKVFVAVPGITGWQGVEELDTSRRVEDLYYKGHGKMTPVAYCYKLESRAVVEELMARHRLEDNELATKHYKELMELRKQHGV